MKTINNAFKLHSLASGSKGNCLLVCAGESKFLVDMGISTRNLQKKLSTLNLCIEDLSAIFITHEHQDHVSGLPVLMKNYNIKVYAKEATWKNMRAWRDLRKNYCQTLADNLLLDQVYIQTFPLSHDAVDPIGYNFHYNNQKLSFVTDTGFPSAIIKEQIRDADFLVLEANHDANMLKYGNYPQMLKARISSNKGHLGNLDAAWLLAETSADKHMQVLLAHLSQENNLPHIALETVSEVLRKTNKLHKVNLQVASQEQIISI